MSSKEKISGIYCIRNIINNKRYVGYARDIDQRKVNHFSRLRGGKHKNSYLQRAFNKYGEENFVFELIQITEDCLDVLSNMEVYWIVYFQSFVKFGFGYNLNIGGSGGFSLLDESRKKISDGNKGKERSLEQREKYSLSKMGENNSFYNKKHSEKNLRKFALKSQGLKVKSNTTSRFVGVSKNKKYNNWMADITYEGEIIRIGTFAYETEAAMAYNEYALELYGFNAKLNLISNEDIEELWRF